eukprot:747420-Hanusia_phi.AAC.2
MRTDLDVEAEPVHMFDVLDAVDFSGSLLVEMSDEEEMEARDLVADDMEHTVEDASFPASQEISPASKLHQDGVSPYGSEHVSQPTSGGTRNVGTGEETRWTMWELSGIQHLTLQGPHNRTGQHDSELTRKHLSPTSKSASSVYGPWTASRRLPSLLLASGRAARVRTQH